MTRLAPLRAIAKRVVFHRRGVRAGANTVEQLLQCGHVVERAVSHAPARRARCEPCAAEREASRRGDS